MQDIKHHFNFIIDLETSGSDPYRNGIIDFVMLVTDQNLNLVDSIRRKIKPPGLNRSNWSLEAEKVHGHKYRDVLKYMSNSDFCYELLCFLKQYKHPENYPCPFICHASPTGFKSKKGQWIIHPWFDYFFLEFAMRKEFFDDGLDMRWAFWKVFNTGNLISTVKMSRGIGFKKNNLKACAERINFKLDHHDPMSDALCTLEYYKYLIDWDNVAF